MRLLFTSLMLLAGITIYAQHRTARFQHFTIEDGLAQNMVDCMLQDRKGFMWFGTWNGLCRYDGYTFEIFNTEGTSSKSLGSNFIYSLYEDDFGNIWIGTRQGMYVYLYDKDLFVNASSLFLKEDPIGQSRVNTISRYNDTTMLVGSERGLSFIRLTSREGDLQLMSQLAFSGSPSSLSGTVINDLSIGPDNSIWVATDAGIVVLSSEGIIINRYTNDPDDASSLSSNLALSIFDDHNGSMWIGTDYGLNQLILSTNEFMHYMHVAGSSFGPPHNTIMDINADKKGNIILATLGGLSIVTKSLKTFVNYNSENYSEHTLSNDFINCLLTDKDGNLWIGTERGGINLLNTDQNIFEHYEYKVDSHNSLSHRTINSIFEDKKFLWIGTAGGGLNKYDKQQSKFYHYQNDPDDASSVSSDFITCIHRDKSKRIWAGTWGSGLNRLVNEGTDKESFVRYHITNTPGFTSNFISSIDEDNRGNLWIGTLNGLIFYNSATNSFEQKFNSETHRITEVGCLLLDSKQRLWVGTRRGLYMIEHPNERNALYIKKYEHDPTNPKSLSGNYVISMIEDNNGSMWFGTYGQGVNKLDIETGNFISYSTADGLSNNIIFGLQQDIKNDIWLSTDYGLSRLRPETDDIRNFYSYDGLLNNQYYWSASFQNSEGKLYFGGMNGLDSFYPDWIKETEKASGVVITDIKFLNESIEPGKKYNGIQAISTNPSNVKQINLSYKEKIFGIEFSSLTYQDPGVIKFAYILEGFENNWNYLPSGRRYASYTNLKPGNYTFKVKASGTNGDFKTVPSVLTIHIAPPFWDTLWFKVLVGVIVIALIYIYTKFRIYNLKRQKIVLEQQVIERTDRINQQKEALSKQARQLQLNNSELESKKQMIEGQNHKLENQNKEILNQRDKLIALNRKVKLVSQLKLSFFTNISHEFKTPLTLILGPLESLMKKNNLNAEDASTLSLVSRNAKRLLHLVNQIMDFRKIEQGRMNLKVMVGNIDSYCKNIHEAFKSLAEIKQIGFTYNAGNLPSEVYFDPYMFDNILYNLLSNAFKYTPKGGVINMQVSGLSFPESRLPEKSQEQTRGKDVISIKIADSGIGISEENLPLVFKRFYRIESEESLHINGSGIGLALTEELIKTHHGEIFVESTPGQGSAFEVQFPCLRGFYDHQEVADNDRGQFTIHQQVQSLREEMQKAGPGLSGKSSKLYTFDKKRPAILVVEDNKDLREFITLRLNEKYNVLEAGDGQEGIEQAKKHNPDVIISDVMMPNVDGLKLCQYIKTHLGTSHIPLILLTAKSSVEHQIRGLELGADDYLSKPFNFDLLEARIHNLIESRQKLKTQFIQSANFNVETANIHSKDQDFLRKCIEMVEEHIEDTAFTAQEFVKQMRVSRSFLHKKLNALTNQSAAEFINCLRMKKAIQLMQKNELNVSEVAYAVGFNDPKYFSRVFTKQYGSSPKSFKASQMQTIE